MNFCNLALISLLSSSSTTGVSAFANRNAGARSPAFLSKTSYSSSSLSMIYPGSRNNSIVAFTTTIHREEVNLESLSIPQLKQMQLELETLNNRCTEEGTQTNAECDVELKDERDFAVDQIQRILNERTGKNSRLKYVDMESVREIVAKPWIYPLQQIRQQIKAMEILNCECTEDGNQTDSVCDVQLKDERDSAIETLTLYMKSVETMLETEGIIAKEAEADEAKRKRKELVPTTKICRDARAGDKTASAPIFDMGEIRNCVNHPGSKSLVEMQAMLAQLEAAHNACTEEGTQTNPECDVEVKAERDVFMESLVSMIHDAKLCMDQIKAFAQQGDKLDEVAIEEVMEAVINTVPNLPSGSNPVYLNSAYQGPTDEFLVQI
jgi:hypothetical protein